MSYRLIDANAIAISHPEVNDMPCIYADLPDGLDGRHYDLRKLGEPHNENARLRSCLSDDAENARQIMAENAKLRELVAHYEIAVTAEDAEPSEALAWSVRCDELRNEIGGWTSDG